MKGQEKLWVAKALAFSFNAIWSIKYSSAMSHVYARYISMTYWSMVGPTPWAESHRQSWRDKTRSQGGWIHWTPHILHGYLIHSWITSTSLGLSSTDYANMTGMIQPLRKSIDIKRCKGFSKLIWTDKVLKPSLLSDRSIQLPGTVFIGRHRYSDITKQWSLCL